MSFMPCYSITTEISHFLSTDEGVRATLDLLERGAAPEEFINLLAAGLDADTESVLREEVRELPASMLPLILESFGFAHASGKQFTMTSELPGQPLEYARSKRVRVSVDYEEDGVRMAVSHVPTRHADWYQPASGAARVAPAG